MNRPASPASTSEGLKGSFSLGAFGHLETGSIKRACRRGAGDRSDGPEP
jgi:hypothetical protein